MANYMPVPVSALRGIPAGKLFASIRNSNSISSYYQVDAVSYECEPPAKPVYHVHLTDGRTLDVSEDYLIFIQTPEAASEARLYIDLVDRNIVDQLSDAIIYYQELAIDENDDFSLEECQNFASIARMLRAMRDDYRKTGNFAEWLRGLTGDGD